MKSTNQTAGTTCTTGDKPADGEPSVTVRNESIAKRTTCRICQKFNKFWLISCGCRFRFAGITTISVGEFSFWMWCGALFALTIYLVGGCYFNDWSNTLPVYGSVSIHSGLITGVFYFMVILLSSRYPFYWKWGLFMIGFDRQMIYHRKCAYLAAVCCIFHIFDHREVLLTWKALTGWMCYGAAVLLLIFANNYFRRNYYNGLFIRSHWLFIVLFLVFGWMHKAILIQYGTFFIILDSIIRTIDLHARSTKIVDMRLLDYDRVVRLEFEKKHFRYHPGQYVFIRVPAVGLLEFHPFSISSYPGSGSTFSVHIKSSVASANGWTSRLTKLMKEHENKPEHYKDISVQIEGPFGELTLRKELSRYEHVVFIGGGIGITPLDSLYNQLVTDLLDNNIRRAAKTRKIDFIFTTRSRSLITEFASRNKAWDFYAQSMRNLNPTEDGSKDGSVIPNFKETQLPSPTNLSPMSLAPPTNLTVDRSLSAMVETSITFQGPHAIIRETMHGDDEQSVTALDLSVIQSRNNSLRLDSMDKKVGINKPKHVVFNSSRASVINVLQELDMGDLSQIKEAYAEDMAVDTLEIQNSTHITRVKDEKLRREYKETYPFINFQRPNIRGIIYKAASDTYSKDICVLTSGPKGMVNECKRWAAEIGVDVHSEVFDW